MNHDSPFTTHGDEPVEARIVSWVLGEASAFEAAELERLCDERPELLVFRRRMRALHGLLTEAESAQPDDGWKLPEEKRRVLDELFGGGVPARLEVQRDTRVRHSGRRVLLAIAACLVMTLVVLSLIPGKYEAAATIEVKPRAGLSPLGTHMGDSSAIGAMTPQFFSTEFEKIKSRNSLEKVVEKLDLDARWGTDKETALHRLKENLTTKQIRGTDLIEIRAREKDPELAKSITNEVASSYQAYRSEIEQRHSEQQLAELNKAVRDQEDKVEERRKVLSTIVRTKGIIYKGSDSFYGASGVDEEPVAKSVQTMKDESREEAIKRGLDAQDYVDAKREFESDQELLQQMKLKQVGESIAARIPSASVEFHEQATTAVPANPLRAAASKLTGWFSNKEDGLASSEARGVIHDAPTIVTYSAMVDEPAGGEKKPPAKDMAPLATRLPEERIEGTPRRMLVPNLEEPSNGPAGSSSWGGRNRAASERIGKLPAGRGMIVDGREAVEPTDASPQAEEAIVSKMMAKKETIMPARPSAPSSSMAGAVSATSPSPAAVPVPDVAVTTPSLDFGDAKDFGGGWGGADVAAAGEKGKMATDSESQSFTKSGTGSMITSGVNTYVGGTSISGGTLNGHVTGFTGEQGGRDEKATAHGRIPTLGDVPAVGRLFSESTREETELAIPRITTRSIGDDVDGDEGKENSSIVAGNRSGDSAVTRNNIDAILNNPGRAEGLKEAEELRKVGKYKEARDSLEESLAANPGDPAIVDGLKRLDDPIRTNPALTYEHTQNVDKVRRSLYAAEGNFNLGKYDDAKREYENTLRTDPYNKAARRGLEKIASAKSDYYRAAYDHTRSELLAQVDAAWELSVPADGADTKPESSRKPADHTPPADASIPAESGKLVGGVEIVGGAKFELKADSSGKYQFKGMDLNEPAPDPQGPIVSYFRDRSKVLDSDGVSGGLKSDLQAGDTLDLSSKGVKQGEGEKPLPPMEFEGFMNFGAPIAGSGEHVPPVEKKVDREFLYSTEYEAPVIPKGAADSTALPTPPEMPASGTEMDEATKSSVSSLAQREMIRRQSVVVESDRLLIEARKAYAAGDYDKAYETYEASLNQLPGAPAFEGRVDFLRKSLGDAAIALSMNSKRVGRADEAEQWLKKATEWDPENDQARQQLLADATSEIAAAEDPYSTFSLNISDASFKIAQAALAKGERPDPAGIKVEQFYNAVDYGDPAPSAGEPIAMAIEQSGHPVIPGRNLVRVALKTAAAGRSASQPLRLTLLVDQSGSMVREDRRAAMEKALAGLAGLLTDKDLVNVIGFSRTPRLLADGMQGDKAEKLAELVNQSANEGGTNLEEAIKLAGQLAERRKLDGAQNRIVLFTDGAANLGNADPSKLAEAVKQLRQQGVAFDIAGIAADGLNDELLGELARNGNGRYYVVGKGGDDHFARQLAGAFRPAAENVKVQVQFNPERVARYKLIGFEKDRLKTEDFRNDAVDAAELAAEEAGVAIYQVEPIPGGNGELGEVSVRFRDAASGQMVERTWTIPHDRSAPAIDRATPSMQLAVLAMLAGEKLKGGPLADAIDFNQLADPRANVKQVYGRNSRVGEVLGMVDALK